MLLWNLGDNPIHKLLHNLQFIFFSIAYNLAGNVLHGIDEIFKAHLILVESRSHYLYENEMIVIPSYFLIGHALEVGQFDELRRGEDPFGSHAALTVKYFQHLFDYVEFLHLIALNIQDFLVGIVHISNRHILLLLQGSPHKIDCILHHNRFNVLINKTQFFFHLLAIHYSFVLDIERWIIVGLQKPRVSFFIDKDINSKHMKALAVIFGKRCFKIVLKEWIDSSEKFLSQLLNFTSYC